MGSMAVAAFSFAPADMMSPDLWQNFNIMYQSRNSGPVFGFHEGNLISKGYSLTWPEGQVFSRVLQVAGRPIRNEHDLALILLMEPRFDRALFRNEYPKAWHENHILSVTREGDLLKIKPTIQGFFEKFVIKGQVLLDQAEQDPPDRELAQNFCHYFEVSV